MPRRPAREGRDGERHPRVQEERGGPAPAPRRPGPPQALIRRLVLLVALVCGACTSSTTPAGDTAPDPATASPSPRSTAPPAAEGISVESLVSIPGGGGGSSWSFPADQDGFDLRVRLSGRGVVAALLELRSEPSGEIITSREERIDVDGPTEVDFEGIELPRRGGYTLDLRVTGDGVSQRSTVTIRRG